jgi:hypothetical protein
VILTTATVCWLQGRFACAQGPPIDRHALVARHNVVHRSAAPEHFLQVGNGEFAYAFDVTGMQTLDRAFERPIPLHTMSNWGWHSFPNVRGDRYEETLSEFEVEGRRVSYADQQQSPAGEYFRANPHRVNLARIGLWWKGQSPGGATAQDLAGFTEIEQTLDLWTGVASSRFQFRGEAVEVTTAAHPARDLVAFRIKSRLLNHGVLGVTVRFSAPLGRWGPEVDDFSTPGRHLSFEDPDDPSLIARQVDDFKYDVRVEPAGAVLGGTAGDHCWRFMWGESGDESDVLEPGQDLADDDTAFVLVEFGEGRGRLGVQRALDFDEVAKTSAEHWKRFWLHGGALDLSGVDDPRARELERRVVLSQYLTAIQNGSLPPQETGLLTNSWHGKHHLEIHWWHAAHFALWGRPEILERSLAWYLKILPQARRVAERQGYQGVRWPKMTGPDGVSSPSAVGEFLVWQQPHLIALAELAFRATPANKRPAVLSKYRQAVEETARFMADFVDWDAERKACRLGPPLIPAQETYRPQVTRDPTFELAYWRWGLSLAQEWRRRAGRPRDPEWDRVIGALAKPLVRDGRYAAVAVEPFTLTVDHPSMLCALGMLPRTPFVDPAVMRATAAWVDGEAAWDWNSTWGWDHPALAMTFARCGDPERAVAALLRDVPKNRYLPNGHNYQAERLPAYLPGNGGVLAAAALMAAGWDDGPERPAPGFPADWQVRFEGLAPSP